jgi:hypothetical protein
METIGKVFERAEAAEARVRELEDFLYKIYKKRNLLQLDGFLDDDDYDQLVKLKDNNNE